jgi:hypothetical protein
MATVMTMAARSERGEGYERARDRERGGGTT